MAKWSISLSLISLGLLLLVERSRSEAESGLADAQPQPVLAGTGIASDNKFEKYPSAILPQPASSDNGKDSVVLPGNNPNNVETAVAGSEPGSSNTGDASSVNGQHLERVPLGDAGLNIAALSGKNEAPSDSEDALPQKSEIPAESLAGLPQQGSSTLKPFRQEDRSEMPAANPNSFSKEDLLSLAKKIPSDLSPEQMEQWRQNISDTLGLSPFAPGKAMLPLGNVNSAYAEDKDKIIPPPSGSQGVNVQEPPQLPVQPQNTQTVQEEYQLLQKQDDSNHQAFDSQRGQIPANDPDSPAQPVDGQNIEANLLPNFLGSPIAQNIPVKMASSENGTDAINTDGNNDDENKKDGYFYEKDYEDDDDDEDGDDDETYDYEGDTDFAKGGSLDQNYGNDLDDSNREEIDFDDENTEDEANGDQAMKEDNLEPPKLANTVDDIIKNNDADGTTDMRDNKDDQFEDPWDNTEDYSYEDDDDDDDDDSTSPPPWMAEKLNNGAQKEDLAVAQEMEKSNGELGGENEAGAPYGNEESEDDDYKFDENPPWMAGKPVDDFDDEDDDEWYYDPAAAARDSTSDKTSKAPLVSPSETSTKTSEEPYPSSQEEETEDTKSQIGSPDFKEGVISVEEARSRKPLQAPKGTIVLYTVLIVFFIAGIVIFSIWKNPFTVTKPSHSTPVVRVGEEGKRLLDHPFV